MGRADGGADGEEVGFVDGAADVGVPVGPADGEFVGAFDGANVG